MCRRYAAAVDACFAKIGNPFGSTVDGGRTCRQSISTVDDLAYQGCVVDVIESYDCKQGTLFELAELTAQCHPIRTVPDTAGGTSR